MRDPHGYMHDQMDLADTYAKDGAFISAARVLRDLATDLEAHAKATDPTQPQHGPRDCGGHEWRTEPNSGGLVDVCVKCGESRA